MEWIELPKGMHNGRAYLPLDRQFLAIWKGAIGICQYDEDDDSFYWANQPSNFGIMRVDRDREGKFTHWCELMLPETEILYE